MLLWIASYIIRITSCRVCDHYLSTMTSILKKHGRGGPTTSWTKILNLTFHCTNIECVTFTYIHLTSMFPSAMSSWSSTRSFTQIATRGVLHSWLSDLYTSTMTSMLQMWGRGGPSGRFSRGADALDEALHWLVKLNLLVKFNETSRTVINRILCIVSCENCIIHWTFF